MVRRRGYVALSRAWGTRPNKPADRPPYVIGPRANLHLPPRPRHPVYGKAAQEEARRFMRLANTYGLGARSKAYVIAVAKLQEPLTYPWYRKLQAWFQRRKAEYTRLNIPHSIKGHKQYVELQRKNRKMRLNVSVIPGR